MLKYKTLILCNFFTLTFLATAQAAPPQICKGEGKWEFGTNMPGKLENEKAPFIFGHPPGRCEFKAGEKNKIVKDTLDEASGTPGKNIALFLMGAPGCGKSSSLARVLNQLGFQKEQFVNIDVDDIRAKMSDFQASLYIPSKLCPDKKRAYTGAMAWCSEASAQARNAIFDKVLDEKRSFIYDGTCRFPKFCQLAIRQAIDAGFTPYLVAVWAKDGTCAERALGRAAQTGRRVSSDVVLEAHSGIQESDTFNRLSTIIIKAGGEAWIFNNEGPSPVHAFHRSSTECQGPNKEACEYYGVR